MPQAVLTDDSRHVVFGVPGGSTAFKTVFQKLMPVAILQTLAQGFLGQCIEALALFAGLRLQFG